MAVITANASAVLTAAGTSAGTGYITWTAPSLPQGVSAWTSVVISGTWTWGGNGSISRVIIGSTITFDGTPFSVSLSVKQTPPLALTCTGNKNATGSGFNWSGLTVTYTYTSADGSAVLVKVSGAWVTASAVYRKQNGSWAEVSDFSTIDTSKTFVKGE